VSWSIVTTGNCDILQMHQTTLYVPPPPARHPQNPSLLYSTAQPGLWSRAPIEYPQQPQPWCNCTAPLCTSDCGAQSHDKPTATPILSPLPLLM
jgi:hypothetical protein